MSEKATDRAPWTGSTVDYDDAVEAYARAQYEVMLAPEGSDAERDALRRCTAARKRLESEAQEMIAWSTSRAYRIISAPAAPQGAEE
jgi:hypothetical protein